MFLEKPLTHITNNCGSVSVPDPVVGAWDMAETKQRFVPSSCSFSFSREVLTCI